MLTPLAKPSSSPPVALPRAVEQAAVGFYDSVLPARLDLAAPPQLVVIIDAEEEFDWSSFSRSAISVKTMAQQGAPQALLHEHGLVPTYAVDYAVAAQEEGYGPLLDWLKDGQCEIGTQLHSWVNPPFEELITPRNTFAGNLSPALEARKLQILTEQIEESFGVRPTVYRAGRYGIGPNSPEILAAQGYLVDSSVVPFTDMRDKGGPDFRRCRPEPYWFGPNHQLLEVPITLGLIGRLVDHAPWLHPATNHSLGRALHLPGMLARSGALARTRLTPEGVPVEEAIELTRTLYAHGTRAFMLTWHSPSLVPGHTPYVRNSRDLVTFLDWLRRYLEFFFGELAGQPSTPLQLRTKLLGGSPNAS